MFIIITKSPEHLKQVVADPQVYLAATTAHGLVGLPVGCHLPRAGEWHLCSSGSLVAFKNCSVQLVIQVEILN